MSPPNFGLHLLVCMVRELFGVTHYRYPTKAKTRGDRPATAAAQLHDPGRALCSELMPCFPLRLQRLFLCVCGGVRRGGGGGGGADVVLV